MLTSNAGWDTRQNRTFLEETIAALQESGARVSLFIETEADLIAGAAEVGADRVELYTGPYAEAHAAGHGDASFETYARAARTAADAGLGLNAGHDLNLDNLVRFRRLPGLQEVSIGHALTCDALERGWRAAVRAYLEVLAETDSSAS